MTTPDLDRVSAARATELGSPFPQDLSTLCRRRVIGWLAGAGTFALLSGCGEDGASTGGPNVPPVTPVPTATPTPTPAPSATPTPSPTACLVNAPPEPVGPYPADGTNASSGVTNNVLTESGVVRSDIRSNFLGSNAVAAGIQLDLTITLVNTAINCDPLVGFVVYLWQADAEGNVSLYTAPAASYLRGVQVADANGRVTFTTIVPGCYAGRYPHFHIEVFKTLGNATSGSNAQLATQLILPAAVATAVYANSTTYPGSAANFNAITLATDPDFQDDTDAQRDALTPAFTGTVGAGYSAQITLGISEAPSL